MIRVFFPPPLSFCIKSFQAGTAVNANWIPSPCFCSGKCTDPSTWLHHVSWQNRSRCIAALHIISMRSETSSRCSQSILPRAASVAQQAGKRRFPKLLFRKKAPSSHNSRVFVNVFCFPLWCSSIMNNSVSCESVSENSVCVHRVTRCPAGLIWRTC